MHWLRDEAPLSMRPADLLDPIPPEILITRAVVDSLSRQCRDNRDFCDCRQAFLTLSTEIHVLRA